VPKVPVYEQQVQAQPGQFATPEILRPPEGAFGGAIDQAIGNLGQAGMQVSKVLMDHALEVRKMEQEKQVLDTATQARSKLQDLLYGEGGTDDQGNAVPALMNRAGGQAKGATMAFDGAYRQVKEDALGRVQEPLQKATLNRLLDTHYETMRGTVIRHEAEQGRLAYQSSVESYLKQGVAQAGAITDPDSMGKAIDQAHFVQAEGMKRMGADPAAIEVSQAELAHQMVKASFGPLLTQDYRKAKQLLDGVRGKLAPTDAARFDQELDGKQLDDTRQAVWNHVESFELSNGDPDEAKMQAHVMALDLPTDKKEKIWDYVKARAGEQMQQQKLEDAAQDNSFLNQVYQVKKQGGTLTDALKLVPQYGGDNSTQAERQAAATKIFTTRTQTDPQTYVDLWEGVKSGSLGKAEIYKAYAQEKLSGSDFRQLIETKFNTLHKDDEFMQKEMMERVKELADATYPTSRKQDKAQFLYTVLTESRGKTPQETWKAANDLLKGDPNTGFHGFFESPQWKTDAKTSDAQNLMWGQLHSDIGSKAVSAIGQGAMFKGAKNFGVQDIQGFADALGGYEKIKAGTPANNAINSLIQHKKVVTPETVKAVLSKHPDGVWQ
jgi:hypothetical protein